MSKKQSFTHRIEGRSVMKCEKEDIFVASNANISNLSALECIAVGSMFVTQ